MSVSLKIRVRGEQISLVDQLKASGFADAKLVKGAVVFTPKNELVESMFGGTKVAKQGSFVIPAEILAGYEYQLLIEATESGGGATNTGSAQIVCGLSGKALRPYFTPTHGHLSNGTHAYFSVPGSVVLVNASRGHGSAGIWITKYEVIQEGQFAKIVKTDIWSGQSSELPEVYNQYAAAVEAAAQKCRTYHCRYAMYIAR